MLNIYPRSLQKILLIILCITIKWVFPYDNNGNYFRQYTCIIQTSNEVADCRLTFMTSDDFPLTITDNGCFMEKDPNYHQLRNFCPLQCHNADFAYVIAIRPAQNHSCIEKETYNVARRRHDWFLWRSNDCLTEEVQFDIGCVTSSYVTTKGPINYQSSLESSNSQSSLESNMPNYEHAGKNSNQEVLIPPLVAVKENFNEVNDDYISAENSNEVVDDFNLNQPSLWPRLFFR